LTARAGSARRSALAPQVLRLGGAQQQHGWRDSVLPRMRIAAKRNVARSQGTSAMSRRKAGPCACPPVCTDPSSLTITQIFGIALLSAAALLALPAHPSRCRWQIGSAAIARQTVQIVARRCVAAHPLRSVLPRTISGPFAVVVATQAFIQTTTISLGLVLEWGHGHRALGVTLRCIASQSR
jgi:hypothetical protein